MQEQQVVTPNFRQNRTECGKNVNETLHDETKTPMPRDKTKTFKNVLRLKVSVSYWDTIRCAEKFSTEKKCIRTYKLRWQTQNLHMVLLRNHKCAAPKLPVGGVIFGPFSNVDNFRFRSEVCSDVISGEVIEPTGVKFWVKFGDSRSNRFRDTWLPHFVANDNDDAGWRILCQ